MKITRIFSDEKGESHFEDLEIPLIDQGEIGFLSENFEVKKLQFRKVSADYDYDFHHAPQKQNSLCFWMEVLRYKRHLEKSVSFRPAKFFW